MTLLRKNFHIAIKSHWKRWPDFIEIFERRNLIAHGESKFTRRYVEICTKHQHKGSEKLLNTPILLTPAYLTQSVNVLLEFSVLLVFSLWRKQFPDDEKKAFESVGQNCFMLISNKRFKVSIRILEYVLALKNTKAPEDIRRMMVVNLASAYKHMKDAKRCVEVLDSMDWSASADNYKICVAALKENIIEVLRLMPVVVSSKTIEKEDLRDWPVFSFMRDNSEFCERFHEIFGESIRAEERSKAVEMPSNSVAAGADISDTNTIH